MKEIFECAKSSPLQLIESMKAERMYKSTHREALGKPVDRGVILPTKFTEGIKFKIGLVLLKQIILYAPLI